MVRMWPLPWTQRPPLTWYQMTSCWSSAQNLAHCFATVYFHFLWISDTYFLFCFDHLRYYCRIIIIIVINSKKETLKLWIVNLIIIMNYYYEWIYTIIYMTSCITKTKLTTSLFEQWAELRLRRHEMAPFARWLKWCSPYRVQQRVLWRSVEISLSFQSQAEIL